MTQNDNCTDVKAKIEGFRQTLSAFAFTSPTGGPRRSPRNLSAKAPIQVSKDSRSSLQLPVLSTPHSNVASKKITGSAGKKSSHKRATPTVKEELLGTLPEKKAKSAAKVKRKRGYAHPDTYAHLNPLQDHLKPDLDIMFCGINPGVKSAQLGHHFANPTNHFYRCLHGSQLTDEKLSPTEDYTLPERFSLGLTNIVCRPSAEAGELANDEFSAGVPELLEKIARFRPRIVCFVGKQVWVAFERVVRKTVVADSPPQDIPLAQDRKGRKRSRATAKTNFVYDIQPYKALHPRNPDSAVAETLFFVLPSTSGRVVSHQLKDKIELCKILKLRLEAVKAGQLDTSSTSVIPLPGEGLDS